MGRLWRMRIRSSSERSVRWSRGCFMRVLLGDGRGLFSAALERRRLGGIIAKCKKLKLKGRGVKLLIIYR